ncbi:MAG: ATP-binding protein [Gemmatimonadota bacterium]
MNLNKLFPRLSIRAKLAIAFASLSLVPLAVTGVLGTRVTLRNIRAQAKATLEHDLEMAEQQTERSLEEVERSVTYLALHVLGPLLAPSEEVDWEAAASTVSSFLTYTPALFRVKVVDANGRLLFVGRAGGYEPPGPEGYEAGGMYYALRARGLRQGERLMLPVELRGDGSAGEGVATIPAVAILLPVMDADGTLRGAVIGEAYASVLFARLELGSPHLKGVTGLVDSDGLFLYHSERKRDWASLLASRSEVDLGSDFPAEVTRTILSGSSGTVLASDQGIVSFLPLQLSELGMRPLILYRVVPLSALEAPARRFLHWVAVGALVVLVLVLGLAVLAAHQLTRPIYQLSQGARRLARGLSQPPLQIATNDELEDLAADFSAMARALAEQRQKLEELVAERTLALREAHAELSGILEHSADAIVGLDLEGRIRVWNRGAEDLFGYAASEAVGVNVDALLLPGGEDWKSEAAFIRREAAEQGAVVNFHTKRVARDGQPFPVSLTQTVIRDDEGCPLGFSLIIRDTRLQAKLEEQMRHSERLAAVSVMTAGVAHELGNPLAVIGNRIECMEREIRERGEGSFLEDDLAVLREHTDRLDGVIRDLLSFAHEDHEEPVRVALGEVVERVTSLLKRTYMAREVELETRLDDQLPLLMGNLKAIETVCMNLLLNALDATPPGGTVTVEARRSREGDTVELEVRDTGHGVPAELRNRIFEPFFTTKRSGHGTGLGLSVCRSIVERHRGRIWVESREGHGSRFVVSLPLRG